MYKLLAIISPNKKKSTATYSQMKKSKEEVIKTTNIKCCKRFASNNSANHNCPQNELVNKNARHQLVQDSYLLQKTAVISLYLM